METHHQQSARIDMIFQQMYEHGSSTYTYLLGDPKSREAALIDPVLETVDRDLRLVEELGLNLRYVFDTHIHADHITGAGEIRDRTKAQTGVSKHAGIQCVDLQLEDGQTFFLGSEPIRVMETPGHTNTCLSFYWQGKVFTGDALLIRGTGRTDFQQGSAPNLYKSIHQKLFLLPDETLVYPGHDYRGFTSSTIGTEKKLNPRLGGQKSQLDFEKIMADLKLDNPKKIHIAVPANLACGKILSNRILQPQLVDGIPEISVEQVFLHLGKVRLIDVRQQEEFSDELGHIKGAELFSLGKDLSQFLENGNREEEIVFLCRSGGRSAQATAESLKLGYTKVANMTGGMLRWREARFPSEKPQ